MTVRKTSVIADCDVIRLGVPAKVKIIQNVQILFRKLLKYK